MIQDTTDYISECERQLENTVHYKRLYTDPTAELNLIIKNKLEQGIKDGHISTEELRYFTTETQEHPISTHYPRYIKPIILDDP